MSGEPLARCQCHKHPMYDALEPCPKCRHWSYDRHALACERRACGYVHEEGAE